MRESEEKYRSIFNNAQVGIFRSRISDGKILESNHRMALMHGYTNRREFIDKFVSSEHFIEPKQRKKMLASFRRGRLKGFEAHVIRKDGSIVWVLLSARIFPKKGYLEGVMVDITDRKKAEAALRESEKKYWTLFETMVQGVVYHAADGTIISANPFARRILGLSFKRAQGKISAGHRKAIHEDGSDFPGENHPSMVALKTGKKVQDVVMGVFNPSRKKYVWLNVTAIPQFKAEESRPCQVYTIFRDITERKQAEEEIRALSLTDDLTGLHNRRAFFVLGKQQLRIARRARKKIFLFYADVDDLKRINDRFGHQTGDAALIDAAAILRKTFRESDIIARIGGDEFVVLITDATIKNKEVLLKRLQKNLAVYDLQAERKYKLHLSAGVAFCNSQHSYSLDNLIARADQLMYVQKGEKAGTCLPDESRQITA